jgi:hypothetical protein
MADPLLLARVAAPLVPGASRLPFVAGGGGAVPEDLVLERGDIAVDRDHLARFARVCGFGLGDALPVPYPHMLAFPLMLRLMADGRFPFGAVGLVHLANRIEQRRAIDAGETLGVRVWAGALREHPKGRAFDLHAEVAAGDEPVWSEVSTMLRRGGGSGGGGGEPPAGASLPEVAQWSLPGDLGRRYAAVSGDPNPIHLHPLSARLFGFPRAIAHGMWTKARALAQLGAAVPGAVTVDVTFRRPILLPARVTFAARGGEFAVRSGDDVHLEGSLDG